MIRTSAMGDVALTTPVLKAMRNQYPSFKITLVTRKAFKPLFSSVQGLGFVFPDFKKRHKGIAGIFRLYRDIKKSQKIDYVIDLHDVLRSKVLRFFFRINGTPVFVIDKGRAEKKALITGRDKRQLKHSVERYCDVFEKAGFPVDPVKDKCIVPSSEALKTVSELMPEEGLMNIGVAPYAKHKLKMWPEDNMIRLLDLISEKHECRFWLFGGPEDKERLKELCLKVKGAVNIAGTLSLEEELAMMSRLRFMIAMDSSNMHMAALSGTRVISIWGGTDPLAGFGAWMQEDSLSVRIPVEDLECRPCTIYGKGECKRGDFACMNWLTPERVFKQIEINLL